MLFALTIKVWVKITGHIPNGKALTSKTSASVVLNTVYPWFSDRLNG